MSQNTPVLGTLPEPNQFRDAIHIAIAPMIAAHCIPPGYHVGINEKGEAGDFKPYVGIVDPFLDRWVDPGEKFWLCLYPGSVTSLRHVWSHPSFTATHPTTVKMAEEALRKAVRE